MPKDMNEVAGRKPIHRSADNNEQIEYEPTSTVRQFDHEKKECPRCNGNVILKKDCVLCEGVGKLPQMPFHRKAINPKENDFTKDPLWKALRDFFINPSKEKKAAYVSALVKELPSAKGGNPGVTESDVETIVKTSIEQFESKIKGDPKSK